MRSWVIVSIVAILAAVTTLEIVTDEPDAPVEQVAGAQPGGAAPIQYTEGELRRNPRPPLPRTRPAGWFGPSDYPAAQNHDRVEGRVGFRVTVDTYGEVSDCAITSSSGVPAFDNRVCDVISSRARFHPALDDQRRPVSGEWGSTVVWALPNGRYLN